MPTPQQFADALSSSGLSSHDQHAILDDMIHWSVKQREDIYQVLLQGGDDVKVLLSETEKRQDEFLQEFDVKKEMLENN
ncbi:hypothetical protein COB57_04640 [Candidatus Peregrinibacteria bacterium]|nr:MAG: hypothetical protein COB57_04640 [Candidatus Peregrinibacteria bacterium]